MWDVFCHANDLPQPGKKQTNRVAADLCERVRLLHKNKLLETEGRTGYKRKRAQIGVRVKEIEEKKEMDERGVEAPRCVLLYQWCQALFMRTSEAHNRTLLFMSLRADAPASVILELFFLLLR